MSMIGSIVLIYLVHFAKAKVNDLYTIEKNSAIPIAFTTPFIKDKSMVMHHFLENVLEMELKEIIKEKNIICITSYDKPKQHKFHAENIISALQAQSRKVLVIDVANTLKNIPPHNYLNLSSDRNLQMTYQDVHRIITERMQNYDICIINNQSVKQGKLPLLFLKLADQNLFLLDSRKTAAKSIMDVELLKDEYQVTNLWFVLNKEGYNPSLVTTIKGFVNKFRS
ncbi:MAG TPA: hypothetical protein DIT10_06995 [Chryseobacterium sp.]|nr:hypothetical protein [Chryseobacterium sp.]